MHTALPLALLLSAYAGLAVAWKFDVSYDDGTTLHFNGHTNSGCTKFKKSDADVNNVHFEGSSLADTFELFHDERCHDLGYKGKKGVNNVPTGQYASYKVY
ncbi:hypothetical protein BZA05DRAFT_448111 [Tricharina praecox]|uniref:uncharacterized protein n=1 Tax=Tricharina praecox TaxID=43433 RepID=UPI00221F5901|nr:uncharacterized protein BZA05DRAFT_448111 [Tricharina praecox]KAI5844906.1 hypothetical protein BZA05DRAFT_448111 [Tricharina praecox]